MPIETDNSILCELIPIIVPRIGNHLLILGWVEGLGDLDWSRWSSVSVFNLTDYSLHMDLPCREVESIPEGITSILVVGREGCKLFANKKLDPTIPVTIVVRGYQYLKSITQDHFLVRMAIPIFGRPLLWCKPGFFDWLQHASPRGRFDQYWLRLQRILLPIFLSKHVLMVAVDKQTSFVGCLLKSQSIKDRLWQHTKTKMIIIMGDNKIIKVPLEPASEESLSQSLIIMQGLTKKYEQSEVIAYFPKNFSTCENGGRVAYLEDRLSGVSAYQVANSRVDKQRIFISSLKFLERWYINNERRIVIDDTSFKEYWSVPLKPLERYLEEKGKSQFWFNLHDSMYQKIVGTEIPLVPLHGDFWLNNIIVDKNTMQVSGVIDWDNAQEFGLPLLDFYHLITWRVNRFRRDFSCSVLKQNLIQQDKLVARSIKQHCQNIGLPYSTRGELYIRYWLMELAKRASEPLSFNRIFQGLVIALKHCD